MRKLIGLAVLLGAMTSSAHAASSESPKLSDITIIPIHDGINTIDHFSVDGRAATIISAWRDNGNAHGHFTYLVMMGQKNCGADDKACLVAFTEGGAAPLRDVATASPFDGERVLETVRFANARLDGVPTTVMIRADLGESASGVLADHAPADISIYRLESPGVEPGTTPDVFTLVSKTRASGLYCNADVALAAALHFPEPDTLGKGPGGCFD
jgi:hypothetical protein